MKTFKLFFAVCAIGTAAMLISCKKGGDAMDNIISKRVSRIDTYNASVKSVRMVFRYDTQNRLSEIAYSYPYDTIPIYASYTYPNANTIIIINTGTNVMDTTTYKLNDQGAIVSILKGDAETNMTYVGGCLQKIEKPAWSSTYRAGTSISNLTWGGGDIATSVKREVYSADPLQGLIETTTYEYYTTFNKSCGVDLWYYFMEGEIFGHGRLGNPPVHLPSKTITYSGPLDGFDETYLYETDSNGYVVSVFQQHGDRKWLRYEISYQ